MRSLKKRSFSAEKGGKMAHYASALCKIAKQFRKILFISFVYIY
jgi:hypothetical protein